MKKKFRITLTILLVVIATQLIGCSFINANAIGEIVDEGKVTMANVVNEKKSFTQKIYDIIFGEEPEPEPRPIKRYTKNHTIPDELRETLFNEYFAYYRVLSYDYYKYAISLKDAWYNSEIQIDTEFKYKTFFADTASYTNIYDIVNGKYDFLSYAYTDLPVVVNGTYAGYEEYSVNSDEVLLLVNGTDGHTSFLIRTQYNPDIEKYKAGDPIIAYGVFEESIYIDDNSAGYTKQVAGGGVIWSDIYFNMNKDIIKNYKLTQDEKDFFYTSYEGIEEQGVMDPETGEMEIGYVIMGMSLTEKELSGYPYTTNSITKNGPYIDIELRMDYRDYDDGIYDRLRLCPDGTAEYSYSYLSDNRSLSKETPADYFSLAWRDAKVSWIK